MAAEETRLRGKADNGEQREQAFSQEDEVKVAIYARVSTHEQTAENQLLELRQYVVARGWNATEYVDHGVSGAKDRRPALDQLTVAVGRHKVQAVVCWRLDRLGRNLRHLVLLLDEWQARGVAFVTPGEGIDTSTAAGRLVAGVLASIAEFERARIQERIHAGLARARAQGKRRGRPRIVALPPGAPSRITVHGAAAQWGVSKSTAARRLATGWTPDVGKTPAADG
jgi:DNA invertase Pin-like site-specific DNA recombinase